MLQLALPSQMLRHSSLFLGSRWEYCHRSKSIAAIPQSQTAECSSLTCLIEDAGRKQITQNSNLIVTDYHSPQNFEWITTFKMLPDYPAAITLSLVQYPIAFGWMIEMTQ